MPELSINVLTKHNQWDHADIEVKVDNVVIVTRRVSRVEVDNILNFDEEKERVLSMAVALILRNIVLLPADSLATVQARAAGVTVKV